MEGKRTTTRKILFSLGPGLELQVRMYKMIREVRKKDKEPSSYSEVMDDPSELEEIDILLSAPGQEMVLPGKEEVGETEEKVKTVVICEDTDILLPAPGKEEVGEAKEKAKTVAICEDTDSILSRATDIKYYQEFGGEKVVFEKEEVAAMRTFGKPGLTLLGFKPKSKLKLQQYLKPADFIYPDDSCSHGSKQLFSALLQKCLEKDVIAICKFISQSKSAPVFAALVPQKEELEGNIQVSPPGFHLVILPFAEDIRKIPLPEPGNITSDQIDKAKEMIKKLSFKFHSECFEDPVLQKLYPSMEALALEDEETDEIDIETKIKEKLGPTIEAFKKAVGYDSEAKGTKRKTSQSASTATKRRKDDEPVDVEAAARNGTLSTLTVPQLKEYLTRVGKMPRGKHKKQDLIDAVNKHLGLS